MPQEMIGLGMENFRVFKSAEIPPNYNHHWHCPIG